MNNSTLVKLCVDAEYCSFRTVSRDDQGKRQVFYGLRDQFLALQQKSEVVMKDGSNFAVFRADRNRNTLTIMFYWLSTNIEGYVTGKTQQVILPYDRTLNFVKDCAERKSEECRILSLPNVRSPRIVFDSKEKLKKVVNNRIIRSKLSKFLRNAFQWNSATEIRLYDDFVPYSFFFQEMCGDTVGLEGGVILHGVDEPKAAYYAIHT